MSDLPNLDAARVALANVGKPRCNESIRLSGMWVGDCELQHGHAGSHGWNYPKSDFADHLRDALAAVDALTARLTEAPAVVVTQGVGFTEERLRREEAERRLDEAYEYVERERDAARREGLEEAQRIAADLSGAYREKYGGGGDYCAALSALTMALAAKVTP